MDHIFENRVGRMVESANVSRYDPYQQSTRG